MVLPERWARIPGFPNYNVSNHGRVVNILKDRIMTQSPNEKGELTVGLNMSGHQYRRSVKVLVANAFVSGKTDVFNTVIQLDCERDNTGADNLMWRPRWFAWRYNVQFDNIPDWAWVGPIVNEETGIEYQDMVWAAMMEGLLMFDIRQSMRNKVPVFPSATTFAFS